MIQETTMRGTIGGKEAIRSKEVTVGWVFAVHTPKCGRQININDSDICIHKSLA